MLKAGIIGLGHGSRVLIDAFRLNNIEIYGIASKNFSKAIKISKEKKINKTFRTWKDLVNDKQIDIVAIAVPPYLQIDILKECLKKNKKVLCEKPLGIDIRKINNLFSYVQEKQKFFFVDYIFPEHEAFKKFYRIINRRKINKNDIIRIYLNTQTYVNKNKIINWKSDPNKGGGIVNLFLSHIIDYLIWFFGPINKTSCKIYKKGVREIYADCLIEFKSNINAKILINTDNPKKTHLIQYTSNKYKIALKNSGSDYGKKFTINFKKVEKNNKSKFINIPFHDLTTRFKGDSRILLTSRIIKKIKKDVSKTYQVKNLKRFRYNEYILHCVRKAVKCNKTIQII